ncbi:MAG: DUF378 domain-containing protein [Planctomycetota bacterium]
MAVWKLKALDWVAASVVLMGGLNLGLAGLFGVDLLARILGETIVTNLVYVIVGHAAVYAIASMGAVRRRRGIDFGGPGHA